MAIYEDRMFQAIDLPLTMRDGDTVRRCQFEGTENTAFAIVADGVKRATIESCTFRQMLSGIRVSKGSSDILIRNCEITKWRTYGIAMYECQHVTIEDTNFAEPWAGSAKKARQAIVAYAKNTGLRIRRVRAAGMPRIPWPEGTGDQIALQFADDFLLEDVHSFDGGENGIAVCGCRNGVLRRCQAWGNDGHGIQIGLSESPQVPDGLPCEAIYLEACATHGNALRLDGTTKVAAGLYFQNCSDVLATACTADEVLQGAHIALCKNTKLGACVLNAPKPLAMYSSTNSGLI